MSTPGWIDPDKLLVAATDLAQHHDGPGRPKHTHLRRAVSTAYYAVYHAICFRAVDTLLPDAQEETRLGVVRGFGHRELKDCCAWVAQRQGKVAPSLKPLVEAVRATQLITVADTFCDLQEVRHRADYDHFAVFSKATTVAHVDDARRCVDELARADQQDLQAFATLLAMRASSYR